VPETTSEFENAIITNYNIQMIPVGKVIASAAIMSGVLVLGAH
jgi:hypothetical protein